MRLMLVCVFLLGTAPPAIAWSEANCRLKCRLTAIPQLVNYCINDKSNCAQYRGGVHRPEAYVRQNAAEFNKRNAALKKEQVRKGTYRQFYR